MAERIIESIWNLAGFKVGSMRVPDCGQVAVMRRGVNRAGLGASGALLRALQISLDFPASLPPEIHPTFMVFKYLQVEEGMAGGWGWIL